MAEDAGGVRTRAELQRLLDAHRGWLQVIEVAPGVVTKGRSDLRAVVDRLPWPNVRGKRCLDLGTADGCLAFELERRGAAHVTAVHVPGPGGSQPSEGSPDRRFRVAAELLGSQAEWRSIRAYDLDPAEIGSFDVVVCDGLLVRLDDPVRALEAVRRVTAGVLLSSEPLEPWLSVVGRGVPLLTLDAADGHGFRFNGSAHKRLLGAAGFGVDRVSKPFVVTVDGFGRARGARAVLDGVAVRLLAGTSAPGVLHRALLARPLTG